LPSAECSTHTFAAGRRGKNDNEKPHINGSFIPLRVFILYFTEAVTLLAMETNRYNYWCTESLDEGPPPQPDVNEAEMSVYLATIQMGHCLTDQLTLLSKNGQVLQSILQQHDERKQIFTHT
jgi:hypothetical protein